MTFLADLFRGDTVTSAMFVLSVVSALGLGLGKLRLGGIGLGSAGVLFAGIAFGRAGVRITPDVAHFVKESGLVVFVFMIGMQNRTRICGLPAPAWPRAERAGGRGGGARYRRHHRAHVARQHAPADRRRALLRSHHQ